MRHLLRCYVFIVLSGLLNACTNMPERGWNPVACASECTSGELEAAVAPPVHATYIGSDGWGAVHVVKGAVPPAGKVPVSFMKTYLEFEETHGAPTDVNQLRAIRHYLDSKRTQDKPVLIVVYVHGWHHDADPSNTGENDNIVKFDYLLARAADSVRRMAGAKAHEVLGIYVGWRGESTNIPIASFLSVGNRASAADTIGRAGLDDSSVTGLHASLMAISKSMHDRDDDSRMIVIGHSFGGRMLSRAFMPELVAGNPQPLGAGTIINTINPAIGAEEFKPVFRPVDQSGAANNEGKTPAWIMLTTNNDFATRSAYPAGAWLQLLSADAASSDTKRTIGHYRPYITHVFNMMHCADSGNKERYGCERDWQLQSVVENGWEAVRTGSPFVMYFPVLTSTGFGPRGDAKYCGMMQRRPEPAGVRKKIKDLPACAGLDADHEKIVARGLGSASVPVGGHLWNIRTSGDVLDFAENSFWKFSTHNGYVQTNWMRMLVELVFQPDISAGIPPIRSAAATLAAQ